MWETVSFPPSWRDATVIPITKPGKVHTAQSKYDRLETFIRDAFVNNQHVVTVFFDLEKAGSGT